MTDEEKSRAMELVTMHGEAYRLVGFLEAVSYSPASTSMEDLFIEMSSDADGMARYFRDRIWEAMGL